MKTACMDTIEDRRYFGEFEGEVYSMRQALQMMHDLCLDILADFEEGDLNLGVSKMETAAGIAEKAIHAPGPQGWGIGAFEVSGRFRMAQNRVERLAIDKALVHVKEARELCATILDGDYDWEEALGR